MAEWKKKANKPSYMASSEGQKRRDKPRVLQSSVATRAELEELSYECPYRKGIFFFLICNPSQTDTFVKYI